MGSSTGLLACATWRSAVCGVVRLRQGTAEQEVKWDEASRQPWDPMDPPEVGPRRSPGLSGHVGPGGVRYRATRLRYVAPCR